MRKSNFVHRRVIDLSYAIILVGVHRPSHGRWKRFAMTHVGARRRDRHPEVQGRAATGLEGPGGIRVKHTRRTRFQVDLRRHRVFERPERRLPVSVGRRARKLVT